MKLKRKFSYTSQGVCICDTLLEDEQPNKMQLTAPRHLIRIVKFNAAAGCNFSINHYNLVERCPPDSACELIALFPADSQATM